MAEQADNDEGYLSVNVAAIRLGVTPRTVRNRLQSGQLRGRQLPNGWWEVAASELDPPRQTPRTDHTAPDDTSQLIELAMLRAEIAELRADARVLQAERDRLVDELERAHAVARQLLQTVECALPSPNQEEAF
jgi:uncharacterized membrane protein YebE (DUF533 family)